MCGRIEGPQFNIRIRSVENLLFQTDSEHWNMFISALIQRVFFVEKSD